MGKAIIYLLGFIGFGVVVIYMLPADAPWYVSIAACFAYAGVAWKW